MANKKLLGSRQAAQEAPSGLMKQREGVTGLYILPRRVRQRAGPDGQRRERGGAKREGVAVDLTNSYWPDGLRHQRSDPIGTTAVIWDGEEPLAQVDPAGNLKESGKPSAAP